MKDNNSLAHSTWNCKYHLVFAPKYRRMEIYGKIRKDIGTIIRRLCEQKGIEERKITPIVENINRYSQKHQESIDDNNYSDSEKQPYPIDENDKDIINNIKIKNNYNKELQGKRNNKANFEQRDYTNFDFTKLYANAEMFI